MYHYAIPETGEPGPETIFIPVEALTSDQSPYPFTEDDLFYGSVMALTRAEIGAGWALQFDEESGGGVT